MTFPFVRYSNSSDDKRSNHFFKHSLSLINNEREKHDCDYDDEEQSPNGYSSNSNTTDG